MQQFEAYFRTNSSAWLSDYDSHPTVMNLTVNQNTAVPYFTQINNAKGDNNAGDFWYSNMSYTTYKIPITLDSEYKTSTMLASMGFQGTARFKINLSNYMCIAWAYNCSSCADAPNYGDPYYNTSLFDYSYDNGRGYAGYGIDQ